MGSTVYLALGPFEVNWGKNNHLMLHGELFQPDDVMSVPDVYVDDDGRQFTQMQEGASRLLSTVLPRLELPGYTLETVRREFETVMQLEGSEEPLVSFEELAGALKGMDLDHAATDYHEDYDFGEFFAREIFDRLGFGERLKDKQGARYDLGRVMENLHPYAILRMLAENPANLSRPVTWHYHDVVDNGWVEPETISGSIGRVRRFLIVTEGSSDAHIIRKTLDLLRADIADFFTFVDMEEGYPFSGTGNLHKFCQGLVAIGIENQVVVVYDNDLEGSLRFADTSRLKLPANMRVTRLPSLPQLAAFKAVGPHGSNLADINSKAAAIECYLDLSFGTDEEPQIRWTSYNAGMDSYHGALMYKETYARRFLQLRARDPKYDFSKLEDVINDLFATCVSIAESDKLATTGLELA